MQSTPRPWGPRPRPALRGGPARTGELGPDSAPKVSVLDPPPASSRPLSPGPLAPGLLRAPGGWGWGAVGPPRTGGGGVSVQLVSLRMSMAPALRRPGALRSRCSRHPAVPAWTGLGSQRSHSEGLGAPLTLTNERLPQTDARVLGARAGCGLTAGPCRGRGWRRSVTAGQPHGPTVLGAHIWQTPRQNVLETFSCSIHSRRQGHCQSPIAREGPGD